MAFYSRGRWHQVRVSRRFTKFVALTLASSLAIGLTGIAYGASTLGTSRLSQSSLGVLSKWRHHHSTTTTSTGSNSSSAGTTTSDPTTTTTGAPGTTTTLSGTTTTL